jgi:hypothetical protein
MRNKGTAAVCMLLASAMAHAMTFTGWSQAVNVETIPGTSVEFNTPSQDGCPAPSRDGLELYMASNRPGSQGLDIWVSHRESTDDSWGAPEPLAAPINTGYDEFCPTPLRNGHGLLFVSTRPAPCGPQSAANSDIYVAFQHPATGQWKTPVHLGCGINSAAGEASPSLVEYDDGRAELYFSSTRPGGFASDPVGSLAGDSDIYVSEVLPDGTLADPVPADGLNTDMNDFRPNLRRDGLEIVFDSNRPGGLGGLDIWFATREQATHAWSLPVNAGSNVNSGANETRPFLSWSATSLYFGTNRTGIEGVVDIFVATRAKAHGQP